MLIQPTLDTLNRLKLYGMAAALPSSSPRARPWASPSTSASRCCSTAKSSTATIAAWRGCCNWRSSSSAPASRTSTTAPAAGWIAANSTSLASCDWIRQAHNLLIHGATGCGKTFIACALAQQACRQGLSALYLRAPRLFDELSVCHADGSFRKRLAAIAKVDLVLIDDFAIAPMGARERTDLLELLDDRVGTRSTLITSQLPVEHWHDYLGDPTLADAILDRLVHGAHKLHLEGESMRKRTAVSTDKIASGKKKIDGA